jgi:hypothetical protein
LRGTGGQNEQGYCCKNVLRTGTKRKEENIGEKKRMRLKACIIKELRPAFLCLAIMIWGSFLILLEELFQGYFQAVK